MSDEKRIIDSGPYDKFPVPFNRPPPLIPSRGVAVPQETIKLVAAYREKIKEDPDNVPKQFYVFLTRYEQEHPYAWRKRNQISYTEKSEEEITTADVELAKGDKTSKILGELKTFVTDLLGTKNEADRIINKRLEFVLVDKREEDRISTNSWKELLGAALGMIKEQGAIITSQNQFQLDTMEDRLELVNLLKGLQPQAEALPEESAIKKKFFSILGKLGKMVGPLVEAKTGVPIGQLLEDKEEKEEAK